MGDIVVLAVAVTAGALAAGALTLMIVRRGRRIAQLEARVAGLSEADALLARVRAEHEPPAAGRRRHLRALALVPAVGVAAYRAARRPAAAAAAATTTMAALTVMTPTPEADLAVPPGSVPHTQTYAAPGDGPPALTVAPTRPHPTGPQVEPVTEVAPTTGTTATLPPATTTTHPGTTSTTADECIEAARLLETLAVELCA